MSFSIAVYVGNKELDRYKSSIAPVAGDLLTLMTRPNNTHLRVKKVRHGVWVDDGKVPNHTSMSCQTTVELWCEEVDVDMVRACLE